MKKGTPSDYERRWDRLAAEERREHEAARPACEARPSAELHDTELLQRISTEMIRGDDIDALYEKIVDAAIAVMRSDFASMQVLCSGRDDEHELKLLAFRGLSPEAAKLWERVRADSGSACGAALRTGERVVVPDVNECDFMAGTEDLAMYRQTGIRAVQSTPLLSRTGAMVGMISTHWREPHEPSERELRLLDILARQAADLIDRTRAAEVLRHRGEQFETLLEQAPLGVFLVDDDLRIRQVNPVARPLFGDPAGGVIGRDFDEIMHSLWEKAHADEIVRICRRTLGTGEPYFVPECAEVRVDRGITEYYEWRIDRITLPDGRHGLVSYFRDISQQVEARRAIVESEERFRTLADAMPQMVSVSGPTGASEFVNRGWRDYTGLATAAPEDMPRVVHPEDLDRVVECWREACTSGGPFEAEIRMRRASDGAYRWFLSRALAIRGGDGEIARWFGTSTDIDDQKRLEEALREQDRRKDEFLATLAHELRNPLAPIRTGLQVLKLARSEEAAEKARAMIDRQIDHMVRLVDDLLDVSRLSRGKVDLKRERVDARAVLDAAIEVSRPLVDAGRHSLSVSLPDEPLLLDADPTRMAQVVSNLLNNAAKYTRAGGHIELSAERAGDQAVIRVRDDGAGIPADMLSHVFDLFTQVGRSIDRAQGGLGIGLSLVKKLVEMHGGTVTAESPGLGRGSTFTVHVPLAAAEERPDPGALEPEGEAVAHGSRHRVLVVDDNVDAAESLSLLLEIGGHETAVAHSGPEALDVARRFQPEVVFLDIGLPGMSGYEVAERLREETPSRRAVLVALTGWGSEEDKRRAMAAGFHFHVIKPVSAATVESILAEALLAQAA